MGWNYDYRDSMKADVTEYILNDLDKKFSNKEDMLEYLNDELWVCDGVTGNASESYTFNSKHAADYVLDNMDLLREMCSEFCVDYTELGKHFANGDFEWMDVSIRCYLLYGVISDVLDQMEEDNELQNYINE